MLKMLGLRYLLLGLLIFIILFSYSTAAVIPAKKPTSMSSQIAMQVAKLTRQDHNLSHTALINALTAYYQARDYGLDKQGILTLVDYQKPSTAKRLWVIDMRKQKILANTLVAHAQNSGDNFATRFSNRRHLKQSSLGLYLTRHVYQGKHGLSLRLQGLNPELNDNAYRRAVVVHPASYVSEQFAKRYGRLGRSWGCFALSPDKAKKIISLIKNGTLLYAYYPIQALTTKASHIIL